MKFIFLVFIGIKIMAQQIVPYPYPNYDSELIAKEVVNGTYYASIQMMIKNSQTGDERYVHVPDSPDIIEKNERGEQVKEVVEQSVSDTPIYNRDKMLEDAVLPKYVDIGESLPLVVSYAQTPQSLTYINELDGLYKHIARFDDGTNKCLIAVEVTDTKGTETEDDDVDSFYKINGDEKTLLFDVDRSELYVWWLYSVGGRNFFYANSSIYEYTLTGYTKLSDVEQSIVRLPFIIRNKNNYYFISIFNNTLTATNVDDGTLLTTPTSFNSNSNFKVSAYSDSMFYYNDFFVEVTDDEILIRDDYKSWEHSNIKVRFEYLDDNLVTKYNIKHGHPKYPKSKRQSSEQEKLLGLKEGYISIKNNVVFYTADYKSYVSSGISANNNSTIVIFDNYIYLYYAHKITVAQVDGWSTKIPSSNYAELYSKNNMLDSQNSTPRIGD